MIQILSIAFLLGLIFNAAPGAVFAETIRRSMTGGFREALHTATGIADWRRAMGHIGAAWSRCAAAKPIAAAPHSHRGISISWLSCLGPWKTADAPAETSFIAKGTMSAVRAGVILSTTNPQNIAYWAALGSAFATIGIANPQPADFVLFFAGFMLSSILWCFFCAAIVNKLFGSAATRWKIWTYRICALAFLYLAFGSLNEAIRH